MNDGLHAVAENVCYISKRHGMRRTPDFEQNTMRDFVHDGETRSAIVVGRLYGLTTEEIAVVEER